MDFVPGNIFSRTFPDFVKLKDIYRTRKINLLFSRISRTRGNPVYVRTELKQETTKNSQDQNTRQAIAFYSVLWYPDASEDTLIDNDETLYR